MIEEIRYYTRMAIGIREMLLQTVPDDLMVALQRQMENREQHFLDSARRIVFANPRNPYHEMFKLAGCTEQDLADEIKHHGLETALKSLFAAGVYLTHDEFKGKTPLVRGGREIPVNPAWFLNPLVRGYIETRSSGSRGQGTPALQNSALSLYRLAYLELTIHELGLDGRAMAVVFPVLPSALAILNSLWMCCLNRRVDKWFAMQGSLRESWHYRTMTNALVRYGRALGGQLPLPESLPQNDFTPVARWLAEEKRRGKPGWVDSFASQAVRIADAAQKAGLDISGTLFLIAGETLTEAKRASIEAAGCEVFPRYLISEVGFVGYSCRQMRTGNCVHVMRDGVAVIGRKRCAPFSDVEVDSLLFTTLLPFATRFLINAEMDDAGVIEPSDCQCEFAKLGMRTVIRDIHSYGKLTGQGITLIAGDVARILDSSLPARFGGTSGDYQLVEYDGMRQAEIELRISPRTGARSPGEVRDFLLHEIRACYGGSLASRLWMHSDGIRAVVAEPLATPGGKVLLLHLLGAGGGKGRAS